MNEVEQFLIDYKGPSRDVMLFLHSYLIENFDLDPKFKYKLPFYYGKKWVCYLFPRKDGATDLSFIKGYLMKDHQALMEDRGREMVRSLVYNNVEDINVQLLSVLVEAAIEVDQKG